MSASSEDENEGDAELHQSRLTSEDNTPTTPRELQGWYAYPVAAEVFAVVAVGAFLPVVLEQLARENGVLFSDRARPCISHTHSHSQSQSPSLSTGALQFRASGNGNGTGDFGSEQCVVRYLGREMSTSSFAMYTFSAAVLVQAIVLVGGSSFADYGPYRKNLLLAFAFIGSLASVLFIFITPSVYFLAPILVIIGVTSLGCSFVLLNAFLPLLVANHPDGMGSRKSNRLSRNPAGTGSNVELEALHPSDDVRQGAGSETGTLVRDLERSAQISSKGIGYGYISAVFVQVLSIGILYLFSGTAIQARNPSLPIRVILFVVGVWWVGFTIPTALWLRPRPGPDLPSQHSTFSRRESRIRTVVFYLSFSLRSSWRTLKRAVSLRQTFLFLISWFLLSDAIATISGTAVLFARTELHMGTIAIALLSISSIGSGIVGAFAWPHVQRHFELQPKTVLLVCVAGMELIPLYGLLGYVPLFRRWGVIGLQKAWEIYPIAVLHGIVMGGISSYARSVFAPLIPEGSEAAFFALYAVTDKGSSAFGPALVGAIVDRAGTIRPAFIFLAVLVVLPAPLLCRLDMEKGRADARAMAEGDRGGSGIYQPVREDDD